MANEAQKSIIRRRRIVREESTGPQFCILIFAFCFSKLAAGQFEVVIPNKPNLLNAQINVSAVMTIGCDNTRPSSPPKQTQFKANQTQFQTKLTKRNI